jgi:hypothetical protein
MSKKPSSSKSKTESPAKPKAEKKAGAKASSKKEAAAPKRAAAPKLGSDEFKCPDEGDVVALVRRLKSAGKVAQEKAGEMGEMVAKAVETKHFDRKALSMVRGLEAMSDNKLQVTLPHLMMYIDALGLPERSARQGQLIADEKIAAKSGKGGKSEMDEDQTDIEDAIDHKSPLQVVPKDEDAFESMH